MRPRVTVQLRRDRMAAAVIRTAGVVVILLVIAIVLSIAWQSLPLFERTALGPSTTVADAEAVVVGSGWRGDIVWWLDAAGRISGEPAAMIAVPDLLDTGVGVRVADLAADNVLSILGDDGRLVVGRLRVVSRGPTADPPRMLRWEPIATSDDALAVARPVGCTAVMGDEEALVAVWDGDRVVLQRFLDGEPVAPSRRLEAPVAELVRLADTLELMAFVDRAGRLTLVSTLDFAPIAIEDGLPTPAAAAFLAGGRSLAIAGDDRSLRVLIETPRTTVVNHGDEAVSVNGRSLPAGSSVVVPDTDALDGLRRHQRVTVRRAQPLWRTVHRLGPTPDTVTAIAPARRGRSFAVADSSGWLGVYNATSARLLVGARWADSAITGLGFDPRGDAITVAAGRRVASRALSSPHPEISLRTLFAPVWYEGYAEPGMMWQTSGGADDFQPKYGLGPLLAGTLKATGYAMLISVPLALLAALYVSQLAPGWLQTVVKPTVEMMAAVPTVVVGFLAAIWLAPRLQLWLFPTLAGGLALPVVVAAVLWGWRGIPRRLRRALPEGVELALLIAAGIAAMIVVMIAAGPVERWLFDGDFSRAVFDATGLAYEQRNGIIVGIALGFAVIPVIFTIAEDACSGVPPTVVQAARALGATRWQAAVRLVLPAASPGLVAAVMLGLGRAVGETMIVLMAAGNTPILDLGPLTGMRTMSAAIAFEMPEAGVGTTLFRVLFFTGFLLFVVCFLFTTLADLVGERLKRRYARF